jgi:hypothetical protein
MSSMSGEMQNLWPIFSAKRHIGRQATMGRPGYAVEAQTHTASPAATTLLQLAARFEGLAAVTTDDSTLMGSLSASGAPPSVSGDGLFDKYDANGDGVISRYRFFCRTLPCPLTVGPFNLREEFASFQAALSSTAGARVSPPAAGNPRQAPPPPPPAAHHTVH